MKTKVCNLCEKEFPYTSEYFYLGERRRPSRCRKCEYGVYSQRLKDIEAGRKEFNHDGPWGWLWGAIQEANKCDKKYINHNKTLL